MECPCPGLTSALLYSSAGGGGCPRASFVGTFPGLPSIRLTRVPVTSLSVSHSYTHSSLFQGCHCLPQTSPHSSKHGAWKWSRLPARTGSSVTNASKNPSSSSPAENKEAEVKVEEEVELSWFEERIEDLTLLTSSAVGAIPGPRVGDGKLPWLLALPMGYAAISFVIAVFKTVRKYTAPEEKRRRQIGKNAWLVASLKEYLPDKRDELDYNKLKQLAKKSQFSTAEILRKYIRYALNERPFDPELVADLLHLRSVSSLDDKTVAEILNEVSRRIVQAKGPVIVDTTGFTEKGLKRKVAVQGLFTKILYLAELDEFCSTTGRSSLSIKEIFGVTDEDANLMRIETLSGETEVESLEQLLESPNDQEQK